jgi:CubicO group peptidase (beta-lactamase class C family)
MKHKLIIITFIVIPLLSSANSPFEPDTSIIGRFLKKTVNSFNIPGLAVAIVNNKGVIFMSGYGESSPGVAFTSSTPSLLGSTTKTFTALAIMRLVEGAKIELDAPLKKYLPQFRLAEREHENKITIRNLLNHTSGLSDEGMPFKSLGENSLEDELKLLKQCKPVFPPGEKYVYFNDNYRLLGLVIEKVSGMKYGEFLDSAIFKPLKMTSTFAGTRGVNDLAAGYGEIFGLPLKRKQVYRAGALPSGYIVSSAADLAKFLVAELEAGKGDISILNPETIKTTWKSPENIKGGYAMGWMVFDTKGKTSFLAHGGSLENYQSFLYLNPQMNIGFALVMNQGGLLPMVGGFSTIRNGLIRIIDGDLPENRKGMLTVIIVSVCFFLIIMLEIFLTFRLMKWQFRVVNKEKWKRWTGIIFDFILSSFLLYLGIKTWSMVYYLLPELFFLIWVMVFLGFLRSIFKIFIIIQNPEILFPHFKQI